MRWFYVAAILAVIVLSLSPLALLDAGDTEDLKGKIVAYGTYGAKVKSIDPATCGDTTSAAIQGEFYEGLYTYHYLKRPVEVIPQLAEGMPKVSQDKLTYTIRIRKGVLYRRNPCFGGDASGKHKWATREVKASDFVLAFKRIADSHIETDMSLVFIFDKIVGVKEYNAKTKGYAKGDFSRYWNEKLEGVRATDDHTLEIKLKSPWPQLLYVLAINNYAPIPREVIDYHLSTRPKKGGGREKIPLQDRDPEIREPQAAVGTGAYYLAEWVKASKIILKRNPEFRDDRYPAEGAPGDREAGLLKDAGKRIPFVDVRYRTYVQESNPMWMLFITKQADSAGIPRDIYSQVITPGRKLTDTWAKKGIVLRKYTSPTVYWLGFNMKDEVLGKSRSLRQALNLCFNTEQYIDTLHNGRGVRAKTYIPGSFAGHTEASTPANAPYARYDVAAARKKIEQARKELAEAGVIKPGDPIPSLTVDMGGREKHFRRMGEFMQGQFKKIGVNLDVELNDWPTLQQKVHRKQVQMYTMGWHADYPDPENFLQLYYGPNIKRGTNNVNYSNPEFDELYEKASVMMPSPERTKLYVRAITMLNNDCPCLLLSEPVSFGLSHNWVHNSKPHPIAYGTGKYIHIDAEARRKAGGR